MKRTLEAILVTRSLARTKGEKAKSWIYPQNTIAGSYCGSHGKAHNVGRKSRMPYARQKPCFAIQIHLRNVSSSYSCTRTHRHLFLHSFMYYSHLLSSMYTVNTRIFFFTCKFMSLLMYHQLENEIFSTFNGRTPLSHSPLIHHLAASFGSQPINLPERNSLA